MTLFAAIRLPKEILFGKGQRFALPSVAKRLGQRALICTDERFAGTSIFAELVAALNTVSIETLIHDRVVAYCCLRRPRRNHHDHAFGRTRTHH